MATLKLNKKQLGDFVTFQNVNKVMALLLALFTTTLYSNGDFKSMGILFGMSIALIFTLATTDHLLKLKKLKGEIPSPFIDIANKSLSNMNKSRSEVQGVKVPQRKQEDKSSAEIVEELKKGLNKNTQPQPNTSDTRKNNSGRNQNVSKNKPKNDIDELFDHKDNNTFTHKPSNAANSNIDDLFLEEEVKDDDRFK